MYPSFVFPQNVNLNQVQQPSLSLHSFVAGNGPINHPHTLQSSNPYNFQQFVALPSNATNTFQQNRVHCPSPIKPFVYPVTCQPSQVVVRGQNDPIQLRLHMELQQIEQEFAIQRLLNCKIINALRQIQGVVENPIIPVQIVPLATSSASTGHACQPGPSNVSQNRKRHHVSEACDEDGKRIRDSKKQKHCEKDSDTESKRDEEKKQDPSVNKSPSSTVCCPSSPSSSPSSPKSDGCLEEVECREKEERYSSGNGGKSWKTSPRCKPCRSLTNYSHVPIKTLNHSVELQYTVSPRESRRLTEQQRKKQVMVAVRIMGKVPDQLFVVAKDLCLLIHTRKNNVAKTIGQFDETEKAKMMVLCHPNPYHHSRKSRLNGTLSSASSDSSDSSSSSSSSSTSSTPSSTPSTSPSSSSSTPSSSLIPSSQQNTSSIHQLTVLTMKGVKRLLTSSRSSLAPAVLSWLEAQLELLVSSSSSPLS